MSFVARKCRDTTLFQGVNVSENKFTVIIGKNGCGKSNLLKNLCNQYEELFYQNYCQLKNERPQWVSAYYAESHNALIDFVVSKADTLLPSKIIACSTSPFDQFNIRGRKPEKDFSLNYYQYIGTKESTDRYSPTVSMANRAISILLQDHRVFGSRRFSAISSCL
ncbi:ATP-binding cassette domain-containing protein [Vibrio cholerae]|uniref:ATP-binding cassette domain-containing protein n=1 Tax=Vibrio cholerae TaxID=666 RepID=UPI0011F28F71|nr:ATP-binding cassette domain-containing protein [Vibrio cholerae]KAA1206293.1 ATP-binding cassette domain-containing protein [Vibrio cholerae]